MTLTPVADGGQVKAGATFITPLETLLTEQLTMVVDGGKTKRYPFTFCAAIGCVSRVGLTDEDMTNFRKGAKATVTIVPMAAPDQQVVATVSLKGFTKAYEALEALSAGAAAQE
jgi:invasion protein IalB